jgi:serine O-acetyltransferase
VLNSQILGNNAGEGNSVVDILGDRAGEGDSAARSTETRARDLWTISAPTPWDASSLAGLRAILREDREFAQASWHVPGVQALAIHRFGESIQSDGLPRFLRRPAAILHSLMRGYLRNYLGFEIDRSVCLGRRVKFLHQHGVLITGPTVIGDDCVIRHGVTVSHSPKNPSQAPQIGSGVSLGAGCKILGGVRIGDGATIGPNVVITKDVPPGATAIAPPPRILRLR